MTSTPLRPGLDELHEDLLHLGVLALAGGPELTRKHDPDNL